MEHRSPDIAKGRLSGLSLLLLALVFLSPVISCTKSAPDGFPDGVDIVAYRRPNADAIPYRLADRIKPEELPRMLELGRKLFFEPRLSRSGLMSCASCHNPAFHWTDTLKVSIENRSKRTMALYNIAWDKHFLWEGNKNSLAGQALGPLRAPDGMNSTEDVIVGRLEQIPYYKRELTDLMRNIVPNAEKLTVNSVVMAFDFYVSSIMSPRAPFDDWIDGDDDALTAEQKRGFQLFTGKAKCSQCHAGWRFSDGKLYDIGIDVDDPNAPRTDQKVTTTKAVGLRNIADRPPYFHNGSKATLEEVIDFYDRGGAQVRPTQSEHVTKLDLTIEEKRDLRLFLDSLSGPLPIVTIPILPR